MDINILMELLGVQSLKLNLPENYKSSNEEKKRQVNKLQAMEIISINKGV